VFGAIKKHAPLTQFLGQPSCVDLLIDSLGPKEPKAKKLAAYFGERQTLKGLLNYMLCLNGTIGEEFFVCSFVRSSFCCSLFLFVVFLFACLFVYSHVC
jgi:hypothetical protein